MGEFEQVKPYTQVELDQQAVWASEFDQWWESEGQYHRAGGNEYCRTFAWWAWLNREQSKQSKIEQLEKEKAELQGRIRKATSKWIVVTSIATTQESGLPDTFYQKLEELRDALVGFKEASRGECE